nr:prostate and testis expressed protein 14 [Oryctolagus cuniculus]
MEKLMHLNLFLLGIEIACALQCRLCIDYYNGVCEKKETTCIAKDGASCKSYRESSEANLSFPTRGYSECSHDCYPYYGVWQGLTILVFCCDSHDLCNDLSEPIDHYIATTPNILF